MWKKDRGTLYCVCHGSQYDPTAAAKVVGGPAPRRLAMLPLKIEEGVLVAAGPFTDRVGAAKPK
jgi:rieske iron-sulfur protein